jgi:hypothetical protein
MENDEQNSRAWSFSLTWRWLFTKNLSWQAKQSIPHTTVTFKSDCLKMCENLAPNFGDKGTGFCITTTYRLTLPSSLGNFWQKTTWLSSSTHPTCMTWPLRLFSISPIEDKTERPPFSHKWGDRGRMMVASRPKISFWPHGSTSPRN